MAAAEKVVNQAIVYDEFEPYCKWQRKEDMDILEINLKGFNKEQLRVQITDHGILKISGERQLNASKHSKFYKEVSSTTYTYDAYAIKAKMDKDNLIITLPKSYQAPKPGPTTTIASKNWFEGWKWKTMGLKMAKGAVSLAAIAADVVILVIYVAYMYKSTVNKNDD